MTLEEYYEFEAVLKSKRRCKYCLFFEKIKKEDIFHCEGWCKLMPNPIKKVTWDYCGQFEEK